MPWRHPIHSHTHLLWEYISYVNRRWSRHCLLVLAAVSYVNIDIGIGSVTAQELFCVYNSSNNSSHDMDDIRPVRDILSSISVQWLNITPSKGKKCLSLLLGLNLKKNKYIPESVWCHLIWIRLTGFTVTGTHDCWTVNYWWQWCMCQ